MKLKKIAQLVALIGIASPAIAQTANAERVTITGSSIKRIQTEGALPIQVISKDDIDKAGIVSAEQLVARITANGTGADNLSSNVGIQLGTTDRNNNGNASANLRGLGASSTLVLLNGRRVSLHGAKGNAVDLNSIPLAAIQRVEVLKDGASAIYGTDAIGGVINFILRKDFTGAEVTAFADKTQDGGGDIMRGSIVGGKGDLAKDGFNIMASLTFDKQDNLAGSERSFSNGFQPSRGLSPDTAGATFATQTGAAGTAIGSTFKTPTGGTQTYNRANLLSFQGKCDTLPGMSQYQAALWKSPGATYACAYDYGGREVLIQPVERTNFVARGIKQLNPNHAAFVEIVASRDKANKEFEQLQITTTGSIFGAAYPVGGPYYQNLSAYIPTFDATKPIAYRWRCTDCGNRQIETTTNHYRVLAGLEGVIGKWDYKLGLSSAGSSANSNLNGGYYYQAGLVSALGSGQINPWLQPGQSQTSAGLALP
ncbi:MAG: TonB-dependent receptor plug domain-containing protein, partial [Sterolibacterium sp.]